MKNKNKETLDLFMEKLRQFQPQLSESEALTDTVIHAVKNTSRKRKPSFLSFVQTFSGVAAVLLGFLFLFQCNYREKEQSTISAVVAHSKKATLPCEEMLNENQPNPVEVYLCYLQRDREKNQYRETLINKFN